MSFEDNIKEWVALDNQLRLYQDKIKQIRDKRTTVSDKILNVDSFETRLKNKTLEISDGKLKFVSTKVSPSLSFKYVEDSLTKIIKNEKQVEIIMRYLKENREIKMVSEIKRYS
tara:strand:- start:38892 stop:39233 length:342 start_codon:yes stop_codon:yes gene_type:complete